MLRKKDTPSSGNTIGIYLLGKRVGVFKKQGGSGFDVGMRTVTPFKNNSSTSSVYPLGTICVASNTGFKRSVKTKANSVKVIA